MQVVESAVAVGLVIAVSFASASLSASKGRQSTALTPAFFFRTSSACGKPAAMKIITIGTAPSASRAPDDTPEALALPCSRYLARATLNAARQLYRASTGMY